MSRPLIPLALVFAAVIAGAGGLLYWADRGKEPVIAETPAASGAAAPDASGIAEAPAAGEVSRDTAAAPPVPVPSPVEAPAQPEPGDATEPASDTATPPAGAETAQGQPSASGGEAGATAPTFDVVRVEPTGEALLAGRAEPGTAVEILSGGKVIAGATADAEGAFLAIPDAPLPPGSHDLSVRATGSAEPAGAEQRVAVLVLETGPEATGEAPAGGEQVAAAPDPAAPGEEPRVGLASPDASAAAPETPAAVGGQPGTPGDSASAAAEPADAADGETQAPAAASADAGDAATAESAGAGAESPASPAAAGSDAGVAGRAPDEAQTAPQAPGNGDIVAGPPGTPDAEPDPAASRPEDAPAASTGEQDIAALPGPAAGSPPEIGADAPAAVEEGTSAPAATGERGATPEGLPDVRYAPLPPNFGVQASGPPAGTEVAALPPPENAEAAGETPQRQAASPGEGGAAAPGAPDGASTEPPATAEPGAAEAVDDPPPFPGSLAGDAETRPEAPEGLPDIRYAPSAPNFGRDNASPGGDGAATGASDVAALQAPAVDADAPASAQPEAALPSADAADARPGPASAPEGLPEVTYAPQLPNFDVVARIPPDGAETAVIELQGSAAAVSDGAGLAAAPQRLVPAASPSASAGPASLPLDLSVRAADAAAAAPERAAPAAPASASAGPAALPLDLSIKAAEAEASTLYVAGGAAPGTLVRIYAGEELVGEVQADDKGAWLVEARKDVPLGQVTIRADVVEGASDIPSAQVEVPFVRYADGLVLEPVVTAAATGEGVSAMGDVPQPAFVIIRRGDNLWRISKRNYGRGIRYHSIFDANRDQIRNPDRIYPGQVFVVPTRDRKWESATN